MIIAQSGGDLSAHTQPISRPKDLGKHSVFDSPMKRSTPSYLAYLLRLWRDGEDATWRASLEDPHTGERANFAELQALYHFLNTQTLPDSSHDNLVSNDRGPDRFNDT